MSSSPAHIAEESRAVSSHSNHTAPSTPRTKDSRTELDKDLNSHLGSPTATDTSLEWRYLSWDTPLPAANINDKSSSNLPLPTAHERIISPFTWSKSRKRFILILSCAATVVTAYAAGAYVPGEEQMMEEWGISSVVASLGVTIFTIGFAVAPMILAPFSELNGRRPVFVVTGTIYVLMQLACGLTPTFGGMLISRFIAGCMSSTFSTMVGGVVSDMYSTEDRNTAMALFSGAAIAGTGLGPLISGFLSANTTWRWCFYFQTITCGTVQVAIVAFFKETRGSVLLSRKAAALNKYYDDLDAAGVSGVVETDSTGQHTVRQIRWKVKSDEERTSLLKMITISLCRPFRLLLTEPTVFFFSLWISFAWAVLYLTFGAIPLVFRTLYGFRLEQANAVFAALSIAGILSTFIAIFGDPLIVKFKPDLHKTPEGRLFSPCIQSCLLPIGLFWWGWSAQSDIPWIVPTLGIAAATMGIFSIYLAIFNYLADTYHKYASSALAAQSFSRNLVGGALPLFVVPMFNNLGFQGASSLLGGIGILLTAVPFALLIWGPKIRARSKIASQVNSMGD